MKLTEVAERESFGEKYTRVLLKKLQEKFPDAKFELQPIMGFIAKTTGVDESVKTTIVMHLPFKYGTMLFDVEFRTVLKFLSEVLPEGNLMRLKPHIVETEKGAVIFLRQHLDEGAPAMIEKVAKRIEKDLEELDAELGRHQNLIERPAIFRVTVYGPVKAAPNYRYNVDIETTGVLKPNRWYVLCERVRELLKEKGYVDGLLPVSVSSGHSPSVGVYTIHVE